jgi:hypothetical protein
MNTMIFHTEYSRATTDRLSISHNHAVTAGISANLTDDTVILLTTAHSVSGFNRGIQLLE